MSETNQSAVRKFNPCKIPHGVFPQKWANRIATGYCSAYRLNDHCHYILRTAVYKCYEDAGVFAAREKANWKDVIPELSRNVTFKTIRNMLLARSKEKISEKTLAAYELLLEQLYIFEPDYTIENKFFCCSEGICVGEISYRPEKQAITEHALDSDFQLFLSELIGNKPLEE